MTTRRRLTVTLAVCVLALIGPPTSVSAQDGAPTVTLDRTGAKAGEAVTVRGTGWEGSDLVYVELCGNAGRTGSSSCDQGHAVVSGVGPQGSFAALITVAEPPKPCPCVVKVTSQTTQTFATAPLTVQGVPVVALENQTQMNLAERSVAITEATFSGSGPWTAWFGGGAERTLAITVENTGDVAVHDPPLTVMAGKGSDPTGVVPAPELGTIEPGQSMSVEVPVTFDAMSFGQHTALVTIGGFAEPVEARATTSTYPWGLIAIAIVLVQMLLLRLRNRTRDKLDEEATALEMEEQRALERVPAMAAIGRGPRALPPGQPPEHDRADAVPPVPSAILLGDAIALPPPDIDDVEPADDELVVIDLRDKPESEVEPPSEPPAPPHDGLLPNPFDYVSDETVAHAVAAASRPVDRRTAQERLDAERRAAEASVESAKLEAALIVSAANERAEAMAAEAAAKRAAAVSMINRSTRGVEELLQVAAAKAEEIRRQAELARCESVRAAAARRDAADQTVAKGARSSKGARSTAPMVLDLDRPQRAGRETGTGGLQSAIERAVHKAFKG